MFITTALRFHSRNEPYPYDMSDEGGPVGISYSFNVWDDDDSKQKIKCADKDQWDALEGVEKGAVLQLRVKIQKNVKAVQDGIARVGQKAA